MNAWGVAVSAIAVAALAAFQWLRASRRADRAEVALADAHATLEHLQSAFHRFVPEAVVDRIADGARELGGTTRDVSVMFADIRGFTTLSETVEPAVMVRILNGYFSAMNEVIRENHGRLSRIMGDGLMALFGALEDNPWHPADAVRAGLAMREALARYNAELDAQGLPTLKIGIGVHRGEVVAAVMGCDALLEYTVIGDPVNTASRVETLTKDHGVDLLITDDVRRGLDDRFELRAMPAVAVRGKSTPVATWAVVGLAGSEVPR